MEQHVAAQSWFSLGLQSQERIADCSGIQRTNWDRAKHWRTGYFRLFESGTSLSDGILAQRSRFAISSCADSLWKPSDRDVPDSNKRKYLVLQCLALSQLVR